MASVKDLIAAKLGAALVDRVTLNKADGIAQVKIAGRPSLEQVERMAANADRVEAELGWTVCFESL